MAIVNPSFEERPPIPPGEYPAKIIGVDQKTSKKGNAYLNWKLELKSGGPGVKGRWVYHSTVLSGPGSVGLRKLVQAAGHPNYEVGPFDTDDLIGEYIVVTLEKNFDQMGNESPFPKVMDVAPCTLFPDDSPGFDDSDDTVPF